MAAPSPNFTIGQLQYLKLKHLFKTFDFDHNDFVEEKDFRSYCDNITRLRGVGKDTPEYQTMEKSLMVWWEGIKNAADLDKDGRVSEAEWMTFWSNFLAAAATNAPGTMAMLDASAGDTFDLLDVNKDGKIVESEYGNWLTAWAVDPPGGVGAAFKKLDTSGKGYLTRPEIVQIVRDYFLNNNPDVVGNYLYGTNPGIQTAA